jgi:hypothetical protein
VRSWVWRYLFLILFIACVRQREGNALSKPDVNDAERSVPSNITNVNVDDRSDLEGSLPVGCEIVAALDLSTPGGAAVWHRLQEALMQHGKYGLAGGMKLLGLDANRDLRKIAMCKIAARGLVDEMVGVVVSGAFPLDMMARIATGKNTFRSDMVEGRPVLAKEGFWIGQRGTAEIIFCTSASLLGRFLSGPVESFDLNRGAALSVMISGLSLQAVLAIHGALRSPEFASVESVSIDLASDGTALIASAKTRDEAAAQKLETVTDEVVRELRKRMNQAGRAKPEMSIQVNGSRVTMRAKLSPTTLDSALGVMVSNSAFLRPR